MIDDRIIGACIISVSAGIALGASAVVLMINFNVGWGAVGALIGCSTGSAIGWGLGEVIKARRASDASPSSA